MTNAQKLATRENASKISSERKVIHMPCEKCDDYKRGIDKAERQLADIKNSWGQLLGLSHPAVLQTTTSMQKLIDSGKSSLQEHKERCEECKKGEV